MDRQWEHITTLTEMLMQMQHDQDYFIEQFTNNPKWAGWSSRVVLDDESKFFRNAESLAFNDDLQEFLDFIDDNGFIVTYYPSYASVVKEDIEC